MSTRRPARPGRSTCLTVTDSGNPAPGLTSPAGTITLNVSGPVVWFVDSAAPAGGNGIWTGTNSKAFQTVAQAAAVDGPDHRIFVVNSGASSVNYADGIALNTGEWLVGQGVTGASFDSVMGVSPPAGTVARPAIGGVRPTLQGTVILNTRSATNVVKVLGLNLSTGASNGLTNAGTTINGVTVDIGSVTTTTGTPVSITSTANGSTSANTFTLVSVSANGSPNGIVLTNATGSFTVTGDAGSTKNGSGGTIQNAGANGISLTNAQNISLDQLNIQNTVDTGIKGTAVVNVSITNSTVNNSGTGHGVDTSNIGFNTTGTGTEINLTGVVTIKGNTLTNAYYQGIDIFNYAGTISSADISNNDLTSGTTTGGAGTSVGSGIRFVAFGSSAAAASITKATIDNNTINNFPGAVGLQAQCGDANSAAAPASTCGTPGDPADVVKITNNKINVPGLGSSVKTGAEGIIALVNGVGQGNFDITSNNVQNNTGTSISSSAFGNAVVTETIANNTVVSNNTVGSQGIGIGTSTAGGFATNSPHLTATISNNNVSQTDGNGILAVARDSSNGRLDVSIKNNTVAAPLTGVRPGIRVDAGNSTGDNDVCADISANTSAGSGGVQGIGLRKQGTDPAVDAFGIEGMAATASPGVEV